MFFEGFFCGIGGFQRAADSAGLEALGAAESPIAGGDAFDEGFLDEAVGAEFATEVGEQGVEIGLGLGTLKALDDDILSEQAVLEGVAADAGLSARGFGAGGLFCIEAIGLPLFVGRYLYHQPIERAG